MRASFEDLVLDVGQRQLLRADRPLHVSPKLFALLELLLREAPNAVSKDAIYQAVWGRTFVDEANIPNLVSDLRAILDESNRKSRILQTVHRFGYRVVVPVIWENESAPEQPLRRSHCCLVWGSREFFMEEGETILGRDAAAGVSVDQAGVSRRHARMLVGLDAAMIEDLGSKNGTFVNGRKVIDSVRLCDGDTILLGTVSFTFHELARCDTTLTRAATR